jgi:hypothetical protein
MTSTVLFVCPHGAGKSRIAAAWFNANPAPGWVATTAGVTPQTAVSVHAPRLLTGTPAPAHLDHDLPRSLEAITDPALVVAIDCDHPPAADTRSWVLDHGDFTPAIAQELRTGSKALFATFPAGVTDSTIIGIPSASPP